MKNPLFSRKVYVIFGPTRSFDYVDGLFIVGGTPLAGGNGFNSLSVENLGWPFTQLAAVPEVEDNRGFSDLRVTFTVKKTLESTENEAEIEIYNVSEDSYKLLQKVNEDHLVQLSIGYGEAKHSLFVGSIENSSYYRDKSDWILKIIGKDGQDINQETIVNKSYREGYSIKETLLDMIQSSSKAYLGAFKDSVKWIKENLSGNKKTENGLSISGGLLEEVNKLLSGFGASMSFQNEKAQIIWNNSNTKDDIVVLSPSSGLIGSPVEKGGNEGIEFNSLLIPIIKPGGLIRIKSKTLNDHFRVDVANYKGDTHGHDWMCKCEGVIPDNIDTEPQEIEYYGNAAIQEQIGATWKELL